MKMLHKLTVLIIMLPLVIALALPGTAYADWYDEERNLVKTALGPVAK